MLEPGGYVCIHDCKPKFPGVKWAVRWFLWRNRNYQLVGLAGSLAVLQKGGVPTMRESGAFDLAAARAAGIITRLRKLLSGDQ